VSDITLLTSIVENTEPSTTPNVQVTSYNPSGEPHAAAIVNAVVADYHRRTGRTPVTEEQLGELVGNKVTLLRTASTMMGAAYIAASPGTIFRGSQLALLPKGKRRYGAAISAETVLDVEPGYSGVEALRGRVQAVRAALPDLTALTKERLAELPRDGGDCSLAVFGTRRLAGATAAGAIWLLRSYQPSTDVAEGVLLVRPEGGASLQGSVLGEHLLQIGGEIVGAPVLRWREALALLDEDYATVLTRFVWSRS